MTNNELVSYVQEALRAGNNKEAIISRLVASGWEERQVQEAFSAVSQNNWFGALVSWPARVARYFKQNRKDAFMGGALVLLAIIAIAWVAGFFGPPAVPAKYTLEAVLGDDAGIKPETSFILGSSEPLSEGTIKKILKFEPAIDFEAKKRPDAGVSSLGVKIAQAAEGDIVYWYEIRPSAALKTDEIYQVMINDEEYADREYSWAFQTKAPFQVISTHPGDRSGYVPINSGIEITFNREGFVKPEDHFKIEPAVAGTLQQNGPVLVFLPKSPLAGRKIYKVTVSQGLKIENSEDILAGDYSFVFETGEREGSSGRPYFYFDKEMWDFLPDKKPVIAINYYSVDPGSLDISIYKFDSAEAFLNSYQQSRQWDLGWAGYYREEIMGFDPSGLQKIQSFKPVVAQSGWRQYLEFPQTLPNGYYLIDTVVGGRHKQSWLQITPLARYFSVTHDRGFVWLYDFNKKEPMAGAELSFWNAAAGSADLGRTNQEGVAEFDTPSVLKAETTGSVGPVFLKAQTAGYPQLLILVSDQWGINSRASRGNPYWNYLSTDRYVYQVADSIKFWGVMKARQGIDELRQKKLQVSLYNGYYSFSYYMPNRLNQPKPLVSQEVMVSQFDTIQGELNFQGASPGYYTLVVKSGDDIISSGEIQIMTFAKPAYQLTVTPSKPAVYAGETVEFKVKAEFFDGTPTANLKLKYNGYWLKSFGGELSLNQNGEGVINYTPGYDAEYKYYPSGLTLEVLPLAAEEGEIYGNANVLVFGPDLYLQSFQQSDSSDNFTFKAKLNKIVINDQLSASRYEQNEFIGEAKVNYPLTARLVKTTYFKTQTGQYYDPIDKITRPVYTYDHREEILEEFSGMTNSAGEWQFTKKLAYNPEVFYHVVFSGQDERKRNLESTIYAYRPYYGFDTDKFAITLSGEEANNELALGEPVNLKIGILNGTKPDNAKALFYRYQNSINKIAVGDELVFNENFTSEMAPSVQYRGVMLGPNGFVETNPLTVIFKKSDRKLNINLTTDKESYRPGDEIKLNLNIKDKDGKPVSAEVNLAAVDEALFHVLPYNWRPRILESLYQAIYVWPIVGASDYSVPGNGGAEGGGCFGRGTPVLMADGSWKNIEDIRLGDTVLTFENEKMLAQKPAVVQGISRHLVGEYLLINGDWRVTAEHKIFLNGGWSRAGLAKIGDVLVDASGAPQRIRSLETKKEGLLVYNIIVGQYHTYFAGGYFVHNAEKGGSRTEFADVALFETVQTDGAGNAQATFKAPDNITGWRATALAFESVSLKAGQAEKIIKVSLPFFVDAALNKFYLAGDNPTLRLRAFGADYRSNENTAFSVKSSALSLDRTQNSNDSMVYLPLGGLAQGRHELVISAKQGQSQDSLIKKVDVLVSYFRRSESKAYDLSSGLSDIVGNAGGFTELVFMDQGRGLFYDALRQQSFSGGIRADQVATNYWAQKMLAQYFQDSEPAVSLDLSPYQRANGGISLFPYSDEDLEVSAKIADLARDAVFADKLAQYFRTSLRDKKADIHRAAKALYGLAVLRQPVLNLLKKAQAAPGLTLEDNLYLALAYARLGDKEAARNIYYQSIRPALRFDGPEAWLDGESDITKRVKNTSTIGVLASYLNISGDKETLWNYLSTHEPVNDLNSIERVIFARNELARLKDQKAKFSYEAGSKRDNVTLEKGIAYRLTLSEAELESLKFKNVEGAIKVISHYEKDASPDELVKNQELSVARVYLVNGKPTNEFKEGDLVQVRLDPNIAASALDGQYQVVDYLPSGLKPVTQLFREGLPSGSECDAMWYPSLIVDNAVYFNWGKGYDKTKNCSNRTINYIARVVSQGSYQANPALIQSLRNLNSLNVSEKNNVLIR